MRHIRRWSAPAEAAVGLTLAWIALRLLPFRRIAAFSVRPVRAMNTDAGAADLAIDQVQRAIHSAGRRPPVPVTCFSRALAAQEMLRRRGIGSTLVYGARTTDRLETHVWLRCGDRGVVGLQTAENHAILAELTNY